MHIKTNLHKALLGLTGIALALGGIFFTPPGQSMLATLYKMTLKSGETEAGPGKIEPGTVTAQAGWSEKFHIYQVNSTEWKMGYPTPENTSLTSYLSFSQNDISRMLNQEKISKSINEDPYIFYIREFPSANMNPYPKVIYSEKDGNTYGITANTENKSLDPFINDFETAVGSTSSLSDINSNNLTDDNNVNIQNTELQCGTEPWSCINGDIPTNTNLLGNVKPSEYTWICRPPNTNGNKDILCEMPHGKTYQENTPAICGNDMNISWSCTSGECTKNENLSFHCGGESSLVSNPDPANNPQSWMCEDPTTVTECRPLTAFEYGYLGSTSYPLSHSSLSELECRLLSYPDEKHLQGQATQVCRLKKATVSEAVSKNKYLGLSQDIFVESFSPEDKYIIDALANGTYSEGMSLSPSGNELACGNKTGECFNGNSDFIGYDPVSETTVWACDNHPNPHRPDTQKLFIDGIRIQCSVPGNQSAICTPMGKYTCNGGTVSDAGLVFSDLYKDVRYSWKCTSPDGGLSRSCEGSSIPSMTCGTLEVNKCKSVTVNGSDEPTTLHFTPINETDLANGQIEWSCKSEEYPEWIVDCIPRDPVCSRTTTNMCQSGFTVGNINSNTGTWSCTSQENTSISIDCNAI